MDLFLIGTITLAFFLSFLLAKVSMNNFWEKPSRKLNYGLYLIRTPQNINRDFFQKLHQFLIKKNALVSLEKLFKGQDKALVIYAPAEIKNHFPKLDLLEIEDFLIHPKQAIGAEIFFKKGSELTAIRVSELGLQPGGQFFLQIIVKPIKEAAFQSNIRVFIVTADSVLRINAFKKLTQIINEEKGLTVRLERSTSLTFKAFKERVLKPIEVRKTALNYQSLENLYH